MTNLQSLPSQSILIVDDTPANLRLLAGMLHQQGYEVRPMPSGKSALMAAKVSLPHLILLDINMPEMDGYEVCRQLKADPKTQEIPVIFISALDEVVDKVKAFEMGGVDYITKPFQLEEVLARVKTHLAMQRLQAQIQQANIELQQKVLELETLNHRMHDELTLAREIQYSLLPSVQPHWLPLDVVCYMMPAQEVGGDFYKHHAFKSTNDSMYFALAVGDVSGKGVSAALLMAVSLAQLDQALAQPLSCTERMIYLDKAIEPYTKPRKHNCALCYVELEVGIEGANLEATLEVINAAGIPPYFKRANGQVYQTEFGNLALGQGLGVSLRYQPKQFRLAAGEMMILVSDGVVEAKNGTSEMLGFQRLQEIIQTGPMTSASVMLEHLKTAIAAFVGPTESHDDMTIVVTQLKA